MIITGLEEEGFAFFPECEQLSVLSTFSVLGTNSFQPRDQIELLYRRTWPLVVGMSVRCGRPPTPTTDLHWPVALSCTDADNLLPLKH